MHTIWLLGNEVKRIIEARRSVQVTHAVVMPSSKSSALHFFCKNLPSYQFKNSFDACFQCTQIKYYAFALPIWQHKKDQVVAIPSVNKQFMARVHSQNGNTGTTQRNVSFSHASTQPLRWKKRAVLYTEMAVLEVHTGAVQILTRITVCGRVTSDSLMVWRLQALRKQQLVSMDITVFIQARSLYNSNWIV